jgi:hypothetical protein
VKGILLQHESVQLSCRLSGVVISTLATGPKGCGLEPGQDDGFLKGDENTQGRMGSSSRRSHVVRFNGM